MVDVSTIASMSVIDPFIDSTNIVAPTGIAYDSVNSQLYVADSTSDSLVVFSYSATFRVSSNNLMSPHSVF
jgi:DNA-binding beta-propeller fold protein YncE